MIRVPRIRISLWLSVIGLLLQHPLSAEQHKQCDRCIANSKRCEWCAENSTPCRQCLDNSAAPVVYAPAFQSGSSQLGSMLPMMFLPDSATPANQTFLVVNCPHEAEVRIDDFLTKSTGPSRLFRLSSDQSNLPRRVQISFTTYSSNYRTEHEYTEVVHCQPGKTTTISVKKQDMKTKKICEADCSKTSAGKKASDSTEVAANKDDQIFAQLLTDADPAMSASVVQWDVTRRLIAAKAEAAETADKDVKSAEERLRQGRAQHRQLLEAHVQKQAEATMLEEQAGIIRVADDLRIERLRLAAEKRAEAKVLAQKLATALKVIEDGEENLKTMSKKRSAAMTELNKTLERIKSPAH